MAAPSSQTKMTTMVEEPPYCRLNVDINANTEDALVKGKKGLLLLLGLKDFHSVLLKENKLIQTIIRSRQAQLRREKEMQLLKRVKACLQRVHLMDQIFTIAADLLEDVKLSLRGEMGHLPCKQSLQFLLYLISQYHRLLHQTVAYSLSTFQYLSSLITVRQLVQVLILFMGICARVWQVCRTFSDKLPNVYDYLYPVRQSLQASEFNWVCPDLPLKLTRESNLSQSESENERNCEEFLNDSRLDSSSVNGCTSSTVDVSNLVSDPSDSEEDTGVAVSVGECQKAIKRKAESSVNCNLHKTKKSKTEELGMQKSKKKKKKMSLNTSDSGVLPEHDKKMNMSDSKVLNKRQKKKKKKCKIN